MDTIIGNKYIDVFSNLNIEVSKRLQGEYPVEEIISKFNNFFFNKMFLDITSIKDYKDLTNLQKLSMEIDMDKVILLLDKDDNISDSNVFLSRLVSMGIYNFTKDINSLMYLYNNPNSYRDVAYLQNINNNLHVDNFSTSDVSQELPNNSRIILGIKNVTDYAGSTTLVYLLKKILSDYYNTMAIEIDNNDFVYYNDKDLISVRESDFESTLDRYNTIEFFIVDLGKSNKDHLCNDVLYLVEPSTIRLKKLMMINPNVFRKLSDKKVVLNKNMLSSSDISKLEVEAGIKSYYSIKPLNDREDCSNILLPLLEKLGYVKVDNNTSVDNSNSSDKRSIFDIFMGK